MISSTSFSSGLSKVGLEQQQQKEKAVQQSATPKTKKKRFLTLSRPSSSSSSSRKSSKDSEAIGETLTSSLRPKLPSPTVPGSKFATLPRPPKPSKAPPTSSTTSKPPSHLGATPPKKRLPFSLTSKSSSSSKPETSPKPPKPVKASNLSFSELKKQHQVLLQEVDGLKAQLAEESRGHETKLQEVQGRLEESEITVNILKQEAERKDALLLDKNEQIKELQAKLDRTAFDKERLLMVIESVQRDALTGEPIFNDNNLWQAARDESRSKVQHYTTLLDTMMNTLISTNDQLEEQEHYIKKSSQLVPQT